MGKARELELLVMVHRDGDVMEIIPDLIDIGIQILTPVQPEAMNILAKLDRVYLAFHSREMTDHEHTNHPI